MKKLSIAIAIILVVLLASCESRSWRASRRQTADMFEYVKDTTYYTTFHLGDSVLLTVKNPVREVALIEMAKAVGAKNVVISRTVVITMVNN